MIYIPRRSRTPTLPTINPLLHHIFIHISIFQFQFQFQFFQFQFKHLYLYQLPTLGGGGGVMESSNSDPPFLIESMNDDIKTLEKLHITLHDTIHLIKTLHTAATIKQLQATMDSHIDHLFLVSKSIIQRLSSISSISSSSSSSSSSFHPHPPPRELLVKKIKDLMDAFQGLRLKIVGLYKETIESIYYRVTKEKQSVETIENLISTGEIDTFLRVAHQEASVGILDVVQEIQERINNAKYMQNYLIQLHHMFLDMLSLLEVAAAAPAAPAAPAGNNKSKAAGKGGGLGLGGDAWIKIDDDDIVRRMDPYKKTTMLATIIMLVVMFLILLVILIVSLVQLVRAR